MILDPECRTHKKTTVPPESSNTKLLEDKNPCLALTKASELMFNLLMIVFSPAVRTVEDAPHFPFVGSSISMAF